VSRSMSSASSSDRSFHILEAVPVREGGDRRRRWSDAVKDELVARALGKREGDPV
jgi:hypothetical protein